MMSKVCRIKNNLISSAATLALLVGTVAFAQPLQSNNDFEPTERRVRFVSVMAPLSNIHDWDTFATRLRTLKSNGVDGLTTDIWWGNFERSGDNQFDWSYYKQYARVVEASGLKWIPILSFHQCGGNVGDDCNVPLPSWIWNLAPASEMQYKDERGVVNNEYVAPFYQDIYPQYAEAMNSFSANFQEFSSLIKKVYISLGPAGELRYPSYAPSTGWNYPHRGYLNAYSDAAVRDFRQYLFTKYGSLNAINEAWGIFLNGYDEITPPNDGDNFFINGRGTPYGRDFLSWYQSVLERHLGRMLDLARHHLRPQLGAHIPFGVKLPGVHWLHNSPTMPRAAENAAGMVDYESLLRHIKSEGAHLTFTCLEMDDYNKWNAPFYSAPKTIVNKVSSIANRIGLPINGENAIAINGYPQRYDEIADVLSRYQYESFTLLRINNIVDSWGNPTQEMWPFLDKIVR